MHRARLFRFRLTLAVAVAAASARAADPPRHAPERTILPGGSIAVDFEFVDRLPLVNVHVNGDGPHLFILDTGASLVALSRPLVDRLGLKGGRAVSVGDNAGPRPRGARVVELASIELGDARFEGVEAVTVDLDFAVGGDRPVDGLLSFGLFADGLLTIDYPRRKVVLARDEPPVGANESVLRYVKVKGYPRIALPLADRTVRVTVDSGANGALTLPRSLRHKLPFHAPPVPMGRVQRAHGGGEAQLARVVGTLKLGNHEVIDPLVRLFGRSGVLGNQILEHFVVTFDQKHARVRFRRDGDGPVTLPPVRSRGLYTERRDGAPTVVEVIGDSAADHAGVKLGDRIIRVNGRPWGDIGRHEWRSLWNSDEPLVLDIARPGATLQATLPMIELVR